MAQHRSVSLPAMGWLRSFALSAIHRAGAVVWQRNDGSCVESRDTWPDGTQGLSETPRGSGGSRLDAPYSVVSVNV